MEKSEEIGELVSALSNFQGEVQDVHKGNKGYGDWKYADLAGILDMVRPLWSKHKLAVTQLPFSEYTDGVYFAGIETVLARGDQWICSKYFIPSKENTRNSPGQEAATTMTYIRKIALAAALGVAQKDNDANSPPTAKRYSQQKPAPQRPKQFTEPVKESLKQNANNPREKLSILIYELNVEKKEIVSWLERAKVATLDDLNAEQLTKTINMLQKRSKS